MTAEIAHCIVDVLEPRGVGVVIDAVHQCMTTRGVHKRRVSMITSQMLGSFGFVLMCNDRANKELVRLAAEDSLTGVFNRRTFEQHATLAFQQSQRSGRPVALLLIDGDHFKLINDEFGHAAGDAALRRYVQIFHDELRAGDVVGRIGGEEFAVLLPDCAEGEAGDLGERLRAAIETHDFRHEGRAIPLRVSVGVAALQADDSAFEAMLRRADRALYAAKNAGRNRVVAASRLKNGKA